jgi:hypothetical protein
MVEYRTGRLAPAAEGGVWSVFQPQYQGHAVSLLDQGVSIADGYTLIGQSFLSGDESSRIYLRSTDGGATWTPLPFPPGGLIIATLASSPSGIFYAETERLGVATAPQGIYRLTPGGSAWSQVGVMPSSGLIPVVS